jgi:enoyl-CoA hydratase
VQATKQLLNTSLRGMVDAALPTAMASESASFDEPAFQANLARMLARSRPS